jgi:hypothetical protein
MARDANEMLTNPMRGESSLSVPLLIRSILDALTSHLLHLQSRDAFYRKRA